jgi:hypothetical protein
MCSGSATVGTASPSGASSAPVPAPACQQHAAGAQRAGRAVQQPGPRRGLHPVDARLRQDRAAGVQQRAPHRRVGQQRVQLAFLRAELRADHRLPEIGRDAGQLGAAEHPDLQAEPPLAFAFAGEELIGVRRLRDHQPAGRLQLEARAELHLQLRPEPRGGGVERQRAFEARHLVGVQADEAALHLHVQAAGIGGGAGQPRGIVHHRHLDALARQVQRRAEADDAAAHHGDGDLPRGCHGSRSAIATMSAMAIGLTGARGANSARLSSGRP